MVARNTLLTWEALEIGYRKGKQPIPIVSGLSGGLMAGERVALIGVNGAGKSTFLRTLGGLQPALSGSIQLMGSPLPGIDPGERGRTMAVVLGTAPGLHGLTVSELVSLGRMPFTGPFGKLSRADIEKVTDSLQWADVLDWADRPAQELSDGQLRRVLLARAHCQSPKILLLDEPGAHLDLHHRKAIAGLVRDLVRKSNTAVLFSEHDIGHALALCDRAIVLREGEAEMGTPRALADSGVFDRLFPDPEIRFDREALRYRIEGFGQ